MQLQLCYQRNNLPFHAIVLAISAGPIPNDVGQLIYLKELDLRNNKLDGERGTPQDVTFIRRSGIPSITPETKSFLL